MVKLSRLLKGRLSETVAAWEVFRGREMEYFIDGEASSQLQNSMIKVHKIFSDLNQILRKLQDMENELCQDNPQGVGLDYPQIG